ncbi:efflux RND transporter periplasmic adaptor subunit [Pseudoalteromonas luteoviolacea]|uniref:efflux RND transporter periplasmic adaptor subunit n=1 Tax=Pseudoalteromonas luteoviolacea TaxID=43657 RepID=UPI001B36FC91|nr:efflux RND transporter periplasmic adaptor subunit [Pseudoalteromonas luteoviolacea]MBQ4835246.1 efflux RND transporter periplasmic adaptor subunit [Pseudoalteromonas luteoviolacea]
MYSKFIFSKFHGVLFSTLFIVTGCSQAPQAAHDNESSSYEQSTVVAIQVPSPNKIFYGKVQSNRGYDMALFNSGRVERIAVKEGQLVNQGDLIVRLYSPKLSTQVLEKKATLSAALAASDEAISEYKRITDLRAKGLASEAQLEYAQKTAQVAHEKVRQMKAQLTEANNLLDDISVYAAHDGIVAALYAREGQFVSSSVPIVRVEETGIFKIEFLIPERDAVTLLADVEVPIHISALNKSITATVAEKAIPSVHGPSLFKITVHIEETTPELLGLTAQLRINTTPDVIYSVHSSAVRFDPNGNSYMLDKSHTLYKVQVLGSRGDNLLVSAQVSLDEIEFDTTPETKINRNLMAVVEVESE